MKDRVIHGILLLIAWVLMTGSIGLANITAGIVVSAVIVILLGGLMFPDPEKIMNPRRLFWFLYFILVFLWHMIKANIDVAYRVLHRDIPINPGIVMVKTNLKSDLGLTFLANAITLTPGTLTLDCIGDSLYIHWINITTDDPRLRTEIIVKRFETILRKVFE